MKRIRLLTLCIIHLQLICAQKPDTAFYEGKCGFAMGAKFKAQHMTERESNSYFDLYYTQMNWQLDPAVRFIKGDISFFISALKNNLQSVVLDLHDSLEVDSVVATHQQLEFTHQNHLVTIKLNKSLQHNEKTEFTLYYKGVPPITDSRSFETHLRNDSTPEMWTLSEPYGAYEWWPCKQSLTDKIDSIDVTLTIPEAYRAASNGLIVNESATNGMRTVKWKHRYPITTYLVAIAATNYKQITDDFTFENGDSMKLIHMVFPEYYQKALTDAQFTPKILKLFNTLFVPYPFKKEWYGHAQFSRGGGMEHQTMSFMGDLNFELTSHEMAHQWFGNYVTLNSWHDIWLNEGFATYLSGITYEHLNPAWWYNWKKVRLDDILKSPNGSVYVKDTTDVNRIFSRRFTYFKAGLVLHMLRWELGDDVFYRSIQNYLRDPAVAYGFASQQQLVRHFEMEADTNLTEFFNDWYYGEGYPGYSTNWHQQNDSLYLEVEQESSDKSVSFFEMHIPYTIHTKNGTVQLRLKNEYSPQQFVVFIPDSVLSVAFDPDIWLISSNRVRVTQQKKNTKVKISISPNPANNEIRIYNPENKPLEKVSMYTIQGQLVYSEIIRDTHKTLSTQLFQSGQYIIILGNGDKVAQKIIVQH